MWRPGITAPGARRGPDRLAANEDAVLAGISGHGRRRHETRRANVVDLLRRLNDRFEQVILITHIEDVREGLDRVIHVRFDEGISALRWVHRCDGGPLWDAPRTPARGTETQSCIVTLATRS